MKILIAEDEMLISEMLKEMLIEQNHEVVGQVMNFEDAVDFLDNNTDIDMVICDINFNSTKTGIDLGREIRDKYECGFIYLTSYSDDKTMLDAVETKPLAYLIKPFSEINIKAAMLVAQAHFSDSEKHIVFKDGYTTIKIYSKDIDYIQSDNNYITVFTDSKSHIIRSSLDDFLQKLACKNIVRVHRSFAVNFDPFEWRISWSLLPIH
jgi:two-component system response regulator LytT